MNLMDRFAKLPDSYKALGLMIVLGIMVGLYVAFPWNGATARIDALKTTNVTLVAQRDEKQAIADNLDTYRERVEQLEAELERAKQELPDEDEIPELLKQVDNLGRKIGLTWNVFEPQAVQPVGFYAKVPIRFQVTGDYHSIAVFFSKIGNLKRIVNIEDIKMGNPVERNGKIVLTVTGRAVTFKFIETADGGTPSPVGRGGRQN